METSQGSVNSIPVTFTYHAEDGGLNFLSPSFVEPLDVADPHGAVPETGYISADQIVQIRPRPDFNPYIPEFMIFFTITEKLPEDDKRTIPDIQLKIYTCTGLPKGFVETHYGQVDKKWELPKWLRVAEENLHVIVSTKAGTGKALEFHNNVVKPALMYSGLTHIATRKTKTQKDVYTFAKNAIRTKASEGVRKTIILLSGDGGVSDILNGIAGIEKMSSFVRPTIYLFPLGTGNALFHSLNPPHPSPLHQALKSLFSYLDPQPLPHFIAQFSAGTLILHPSYEPDLDTGSDVASNTGSNTDSDKTVTQDKPATQEEEVEIPLHNKKLYGAIVASYGFHSTLVADSDTPEYRAHGSKRFQMVAEQLTKDPHRYKASVTIVNKLPHEMCEEGEQGKEILLLAPARPAPTQEVRVQHSHFAYIVCTLVSNLERTFTISPDSKPFDHRLRIVHFDIVEDEDGAAINRIMELAYEGGRHVELSGVTYEEIESCRIDFEEEEEYWRRVCVDGLIVKVERGGWMKVSLGKRYKEVLQIGGVGWEKAVEPLKLGEVDQ